MTHPSACSIHCKINPDVNMGMNSHLPEVAVIGVFLARYSYVSIVQLTTY